MSQKQLIMAIGNGGCKIVKSLETDLDKVFIDTDPEVIDKYDGIRIGQKTCGSYSAAGDIKLGQAAAIESKKEIEGIINDYNEIILVTLLGCGTSSGSTPEIVEICQNDNKKVVVFTGLPAKHELKHREIIAANSFKKIAEKCEVNIPDLELDKNYKGSLAGFLEFKKDLVLNLLEEYLSAKN